MSHVFELLGLPGMKLLGAFGVDMRKTLLPRVSGYSRIMGVPKLRCPNKHTRYSRTLISRTPTKRTPNSQQELYGIAGPRNYTTDGLRASKASIVMASGMCFYFFLVSGLPENYHQAQNVYIFPQRIFSSVV